MPNEIPYDRKAIFNLPVDADGFVFVHDQFIKSDRAWVEGLQQGQFVFLTWWAMDNPPAGRTALEYRIHHEVKMLKDYHFFMDRYEVDP